MCNDVKDNLGNHQFHMQWFIFSKDFCFFQTAYKKREVVEHREAHIQEKFERYIRFVEEPEISDKITSVDFNLIYRFKVILEALACGHKIDAEKSEKSITK